MTSNLQQRALNSVRFHHTGKNATAQLIIELVQALNERDKKIEELENALKRGGGNK